MCACVCVCMRVCVCVCVSVCVCERHEAKTHTITHKYVYAGAPGIRYVTVSCHSLHPPRFILSPRRNRTGLGRMMVVEPPLTR